MKKETVQRNAEETRKRLLLAAREVLAEGGYLTFSENKICDMAGVTRGALRHHFPSGRYGLIAEMAESLLEEIPPGSTTDIRQRIIEVLTFMHQNPVRNPAVLLMEVWLARAGDKRLAESVRHVFERSYQVFLGVDSPEQIPEHLMPYRLMFWGAVLALHQNDKEGSNLKTVIEFIQRH